MVFKGGRGGSKEERKKRAKKNPQKNLKENLKNPPTKIKDRKKKKEIIEL